MVEPQLEVASLKQSTTATDANHQAIVPDPTIQNGHEQEPAQISRREGTLELTILKAELTGEQLPQFTQSYVCVSCQGQKNRTPNAA